MLKASIIEVEPKFYEIGIYDTDLGGDRSYQTGGTSDYQQAERWQRWILRNPIIWRSVIVARNFTVLDLAISELFLGTALFHGTLDEHNSWMQRHPLPSE